MKRIAILVCVLALALAGCSKKTTNQGHETTSGSGPQIFTVELGGKAPSFNEAATAFFPGNLQVHPGDTVTFKRSSFDGEPHTVTFGTLVSATAATIAKLGPKATIAQIEDSPAMLKLPDVFPHAASKLRAPPTPNGAAVKPCFLATGLPPGDEKGAVTNPAWLVGSAPACKNVTQPSFDGKQTFYNSGLLNEQGASFSMTLSKSIKPGVYPFMCLVHRGAMLARLTVTPNASSIPSAADQAAVGKQEFAQLTSQLAPAAAALAKATPSNGLMGATLPQLFNTQIAEFGPTTAHIKAGGTMVWHVINFHGLAINAPEDAIGAFNKTATGWAFNQKAAVNINAPPQPAAIVDFPPPDNGKPVVYDGGTYKGGFYGTGIVGSVPPIFVTLKVKFSKPGTYSIRCEVHPDMKGRVIVT